MGSAVLHSREPEKVDMTELPPGVRHIASYLTPAAQAALVEDIRAVVAEAPLYTPAMPRTGKPLSVRMTNCGRLGWVTDRDGGYRYQPTHPITGRPWPAIPPLLTATWEALSAYPHPPEACLVNFYAPANAAAAPFRSGCKAATSSCSAARDGFAITASTVSIPARRTC
jgi:alkylated DNA repair protein (DNA oxidative demethylase)